MIDERRCSTTAATLARARVTFGAWLLACAGLAGCGAGDEAPDGADAIDGEADASADAAAAQDRTAQDGAGEGGIPARLRLEGATPADAATWLPAGAYASRQHFATRVLLPPFGDPAESLQTALVLHDVRHEGGKVVVETRACAIDEPAHNGVQTVFPDALIQSLGSWTTEALPTQADDPRLTDPDQDGFPGGTVQLQGLISGAIYVVQRNFEHLRGVAKSPGQLDGVLLGSREQKVVGASEAVLATFDLAATKHEDTERSDLRWRPLASGDDCAAVIAAAPTLFATP